MKTNLNTREAVKRIEERINKKIRERTLSKGGAESIDEKAANEIVNSMAREIADEIIGESIGRAITNQKMGKNIGSDVNNLAFLNKDGMPGSLDEKTGGASAMGAANKNTDGKAEEKKAEEKKAAKNPGSNTSHMNKTYASYLLGSAMLERLDLPDNIDPIAAVKAMIERWTNGGTSSHDEAAMPDSTKEADLSNHTKSSTHRLPRPIRGSMSDAPETDYSTMSREQFIRLKKQIQRAARDGRRVRI